MAIKSHDTLSDMKTKAKSGTASQKTVLSKGSNLTIASGVITVTDSFHLVNTEGAASTDDLTTINSSTAATPGQVLALMAADDGDTVVVKNSSSIVLGGDISLLNDTDLLQLMWTGSKWVILAKSPDLGKYPWL